LLPGNGYKYNPDFEEPVTQDYLPPKFKGMKFWDWKDPKTD
jgi:replication-associated recombination protein RarA